MVAYRVVGLVVAVHQGTEWDKHFQVRAEGNRDPSTEVREENHGPSVTAFQMRAECNQTSRLCAIYQNDMFFFQKYLQNDPLTLRSLPAPFY